MKSISNVSESVKEPLGLISSDLLPVIDVDS